MPVTAITLFVFLMLIAAACGGASPPPSPSPEPPTSPPTASSTAAQPVPSATISATAAPAPVAADVTVRVDTSRDLGPIVTGGGTNHTGLTPLNPAVWSNMVPDLRKTGHRLNRVHFAAETLTPRGAVDKDASHFPQPAPSPAAWNFRFLDAVVDVTRRIRENGGPDFIMSIHNAPNWMASAGPGTQPKDYGAYAQYCARLVAYYNLGRFVDDAGREVVNPVQPAQGGRITWWEIWNEPDGNDFGDAAGAVFTPEQYARFYKTVTDAMRAVDPQIKIGGPNTASNHAAYVQALLGAGATVDFLALHTYEGTAASTDDELFDQALNPEILAVERRFHSDSRPFIISEFNALVDDSRKPGAGPRLESAFSLAYLPLFYMTNVKAGTYRLMRWETVERAFGLFDHAGGGRLLTYWAERLFWTAVPEGGRRLACTSSSDDIACLAVKGTDAKIRVILVNKGVRSQPDIGGVGQALSVAVTGLPAGNLETAVLDRSTNPDSGPGVQVARERVPVVSFAGYGMAVVGER